MKTRLAVHLTPGQSDAFDRLMARKGVRNAEPHPRDAVGALLLDYDRWLCGRDEQLANIQRSQDDLRTELEALRGERDGVAKALDAERANRRRDRQRHAALRAGLTNALKTVERVRESRDRYRELAARAEAALLRAPPSGDLGSLERRLRRALRKAGFELPPRRTRPPARQPPAKKPNAAG